MNGSGYYQARRSWSEALIDCVREDRPWSVRTLYTPAECQDKWDRLGGLHMP